MSNAWLAIGSLACQLHDTKLCIGQKMRVLEAIEYGYKPLTGSDIPKEYKGFDDLAAAIAENKVSMSKLEGIKPWFALGPPKGGFKRKTKTQYTQAGVLGDDGELVEIVKRMI